MQKSYFIKSSLNKTINLCFIVLFICSSACVQTNLKQASYVQPQQTQAVSNVSSAKVSAVSRVYMPLYGGQTITPPQLMEDAQTLWSPLTPKENAKNNLQKINNFKLLNNYQQDVAWLPEQENLAMRKYLLRLTTQNQDIARRVLDRAEKKLPIIIAALQKRGLPLELAALPLIESTFEARAVSSAGAAGLWQLMPATAKRFGLVVNNKIDERFDVEKSTAAALSYLTYLHNNFKSWPLAIAAYNCGEGSMQKALSSSQNRALLVSYDDANQLSNSMLTKETIDFVPKFAAAVLTLSKAQELGLHSQNLLVLNQAQHQNLVTQLEPKNYTPALYTPNNNPSNTSSNKQRGASNSEPSYPQKLKLVGRYDNNSKDLSSPTQSKRLP